MSYLIQVRRDTAANWSSKNPVLVAGEIAFETDTKKVKIGDGTTAWNSLSDIGNFISTSLLTAGGTFTGNVYGPTITQSHNYVLNSAFDIWQRGTSFSFGSTVYSADQWRAGRVDNKADGLVTRSTDSPAGFDYATQVRRANGASTIGAIQLTQVFENIGTLLRSKVVTLSFYAMRGSDYSATGNALTFGINSASPAPSAVAYATGGLLLSSNADYNSQSSTATLTTSYQRYSATFTVPATANAFRIFFSFTPGTSASGTNDFYRIAGVQLEEGPVATFYKRNSANVQAELAACQRYYYQIGVNGINFNYQADPNGFGASNFINFPTIMRIAPTVSLNFTNTDNAVNSGPLSISPLGFISRANRGNGSFSYFAYQIGFTASAEL
jgi:hypothetical protein